MGTKREIFRYMDDIALGDDIVEEAKSHPNQYMRYAEQYTSYVKNYDDTKNEIDVFKANLYLRLKENACNSEIKTTEANIASQIASNPDLNKLVTRKNEVKYSMILFKEILKSLRARGKTIELIRSI